MLRVIQGIHSKANTWTPVTLLMTDTLRAWQNQGEMAFQQAELILQTPITAACPVLTLETLNTLALTSSCHWKLPFTLCLSSLGSLILITSCPLYLASSKLGSIPSAKSTCSADLFWNVSDFKEPPGRIPSPSAGRILNHTVTVKMLLWAKGSTSYIRRKEFIANLSHVLVV